MKKSNGALLGIAGVLGGIALTIFLTQTLFKPIIQDMEWFANNGIMGVFAFVILYIVLAVLCAPASFHKFISGVLFGFWIGWGIAFIGACLGAIIPFWLMRRYANNWVGEKIKSKPMVDALKEAVSKDGLRCVFLTRVSLILPYPLLNYGFGLTKVTWKDFMIGNTGMIIPSVLYAWWGSKANEIGDSIGGGKDWTYWAAMLVSLLLTVWIIYYLRKITLEHIALDSEN
tara:strand:- start:18 stop:704 length:687 start_codon:yes stop_codon:yes gene_type:complete